MLDEGAFSGSSLCVVGNINRDVKTALLAPGGHLFSDGETPVDSVIETIGGGGAPHLKDSRKGGYVTVFGLFDE